MDFDEAFQQKVASTDDIVAQGTEYAFGQVFKNTPDGGGNRSRLGGLKFKMDPKKWPNFHIPPVLRNRGE